MFRAKDFVVTLFLLLSQIPGNHAQSRRRQIQTSVKANALGVARLQLPKHITSSTEFFRSDSAAVKSALTEVGHKNDLPEQINSIKRNERYFQTNISENSSDHNLYRSTAMLHFPALHQTKKTAIQRNVIYGNGAKVRHRRQGTLKDNQNKPDENGKIDNLRQALSNPAWYNNYAYGDLLTRIKESNVSGQSKPTRKEDKDIVENLRHSSGLSEEKFSTKTAKSIGRICKIIRNIVTQLQDAISIPTKTLHTTTQSSVEPIPDAVLHAAVAKMIDFASKVSSLFTMVNSEFQDKLVLALPFEKALIDVLATAPTREVVEKAISEGLKLLDAFTDLKLEVIEELIDSELHSTLTKLLNIASSLHTFVDLAIPSDLDTKSMSAQEEKQAQKVFALLENGGQFEQLSKDKVAKKAATAITSISKIIQIIIGRLQRAKDMITTSMNASTVSLNQTGIIAEKSTALYAASRLTPLPRDNTPQALINSAIASMLNKLVYTVGTLQNTLAMESKHCKQTDIEKYENDEMLLDNILTYEDKNAVAKTAIAVIRIEAKKLKDIFRYMSKEFMKRRIAVQLHGALMKLVYHAVTLYETIIDGLSGNMKNESMLLELKRRKMEAVDILQEVREFQTLCKEDVSKKAAKVIIIVSIIIKDITKQLERAISSNTKTQKSTEKSIKKSTAEKSTLKLPVASLADRIYDAFINAAVIKMMNKIVSKVSTLEEILSSLLPGTTQERSSSAKEFLSNSLSSSDREVVATTSINVLRTQAKKLHNILRLLYMDYLKKGKNSQFYDVLRNLFNILPEVRAFHQMSKEEAPVKAIELSSLVSYIVQDIRKRLKNNRMSVKDEVYRESSGETSKSTDRRINLQTNKQDQVTEEEAGCRQMKVATSSDYNVYHIQKGITVKKMDPADLENPSGFLVDGLDKVTSYKNTAVALEFSFKRPLNVSSVGFTTTSNKENGLPNEGARVKFATIYLETKSHKNIWSPILNADLKTVMLFNISSNNLHSVPQSQTVSGIRLYPQQWDASSATVGRPVFIYCTPSRVQRQKRSSAISYVHH